MGTGTSQHIWTRLPFFRGGGDIKKNGPLVARGGAPLASRLSFLKLKGL